MSLWFKRINERSRQLWAPFDSTSRKTRRMNYWIYLVYPNGVKKLRWSGTTGRINPGAGGQILIRGIGAIPPRVTVTAEASREYLNNGRWTKYYIDNIDYTYFYSEDIAYSASAKPLQHNTAEVSLSFSSELPIFADPSISLIDYKVDINVYKGVQRVATKSFTFNYNTDGAHIKNKTFQISGLQAGSLYWFDMEIYMKSDNYWCCGGYKQTNTIYTPTLQSYLSTVTVTSAQTALLSRVAKVYWKVSVKKPNSKYRIFYTGTNGDPVDTGIEVTDAPASGYTSVTIPQAQIPNTRDIQFWVRSYNTYTGYSNYADSNRVSARMYARFEWFTPKIAGQSLSLTADEWNWCKEWTGTKVPAFRNSVYYQTKTTKNDLITNEEFQAVLDALQIDRSLGDGAAIAASIFDQIANAINS